MSFEIPILFQSEEILAIEKPIGISIHNTEDAVNLLTVLEDQLKVPKLFPVHRLDKETSGVQLLAMNETAAKKYAEQFQNNLVGKTYVGVLRGVLKAAEGTWSGALSDKAEGRGNPAGLSKDRVPCETRFRAIKTSKYFTMCEFGLITGRQHQIRKHAVIAGHALIGDSRYGDSKYNRRMSEMYDNSRMFLHCQTLGILGEKFESQVPEDFLSLFAAN